MSTRRVPLLLWFWNTIQITFFQVLGTTLSCTVVAYGFARFRFPLRNLLFLLTLGTMMFPAQITLDPTVRAVPQAGLAQHLQATHGTAAFSEEARSTSF